MFLKDTKDSGDFRLRLDIVACFFVVNFNANFSYCLIVTVMTSSMFNLAGNFKSIMLLTVLNSSGRNLFLTLSAPAP